MSQEVCHGNAKEIRSGVQAGSGTTGSVCANVPASQIARDLGIDPNMLSRWCREMGSVGNKAFQGQGKPRDEEMAALKRELIQVRKERDFLREAAAFFAKASK